MVPDPTNPDNDINSIADIKNVGAKLEQGFVIEGFADKQNGIWNNTVESIVFTSPTSEYEFVDQYGKDVVDGKISGHDAVTKHLTAGKGTEYFLSPTGVVDFGSVPIRFDANWKSNSFQKPMGWRRNK